MTRTFGATLAFVLSVGTAVAQQLPSLKDSVPHITTTGTASAEVVPDTADLRLGVTQERKTADAAAAATAEAATALIAEIKARGIDAADIETRFDLTAVSDPQKDAKGDVVGQILRGYVAIEHIDVRLRDVAKAGPIARALIDKGANAFEGVDFSYSKARQRRRDLDSEAMRDALLSARTYTEAVGLKLGRVLQIGEDAGDRGEADMPAPRAEPRLGVAIPMEPGVQRLTETVTVIWEIEGKAR